MNILGEILGAQDGRVLQQVASQFGLGENEARGAVTSLLPAISQGMKRNMASQGGLESLLSALNRGNHSQYLEQPEVLSDERVRDDGNGILGHIFGSKEVSRQVAQQASSASGLDAGMLKQMLPIVAGLAMGAMGKQSAAAGLRGGQGTTDASNLGGLSSFLDMDGDGSVADDLLNFARKLF